MTKEHWFLVGALISDGHISQLKKPTIAFSQCLKNKKIFDEVKTKFEKIEKTKISEYFYNKKRTTSIRGKKYKCQPYYTFAIGKQHIVWKWRDLTNEILSSVIYPEKRDHRIAFIRGFWHCDGSFDGKCITFHNSDRRILRLIDHVMWDLGFRMRHQIHQPYKDRKALLMRYNGIEDRFFKMIKPVLK